jgi:serine/threonine-protein kinase
MGCVLRARDPDLDRDLAIKVLLAPAARPEQERRFLEEARVGGQLQHPGVVPVYDVGRDHDRRPYFTMKLVEGRTLAALLQERPAPAHDLPRFVAIFEQVAQALAFAHSRGVIHRDLKPSNVMVGAFGEVQLMDWGLAKRLGAGASDHLDGAATGPDAAAAPPEGERTEPGAALGSPAYMPPEQANGLIDEIDARSDVFGLGAILCQILTGQPPYVSSPNGRALDKARAGDVTEALARLDGCGADSELTGLARSCLNLARAGRLADAGEVAARVTGYRAGVEQRLRQAELERAAAQARAEEERAKVLAERKARRRTLGLTAAVSVLLLTGAGAGMVWWQQRSEAVRVAEGDIGKALEMRAEGKWKEALTLLERTRERLAGAGLPAMERRLEQARKDTVFLAALQGARERRMTWVDESFDRKGGSEAYARAFEAYGRDVMKGGSRKQRPGSRGYPRKCARRPSSPCMTGGAMPRRRN